MTYAEFAMEVQGTDNLLDTDLNDEFTRWMWKSGLVMEDDCDYE